MTTEQEQEYARMLMQLMGYSFAYDLEQHLMKLKELTPEERTEFSKGLDKAEEEIMRARRELLDLTCIVYT